MNGRGCDMKLVHLAVLALLLLAPAAQSSHADSPSTDGTSPIKHVVVIVQENHTFDNYFGTFPGVNGIQNDPPSVHPFHLTNANVNLCHSSACARLDYDNGTMDGFLKGEGSNQTFGYYDQADLPYYWGLAENYTLFDDYFTAAMGPSLPNHLYLVSAQDDGIADSIRDQSSNLDIGSIAGQLQAANDSWAYYSPYTAGNENALGLVSSVAGNSAMMAHMKYTDQFLPDLKSGNLPDVSYLTADDGDNEHPPFNVSVGEAWVQGVIGALQASPDWGSTVVLLTWDDFGGWYDHVPPPQLDKYGDGFRVPLLMVSPFAKQGFIDHTFSDHTSVMKFIERVFGVPHVTQRDASASDLFEALNPSYASLGKTFGDDSLLLQGTPAFLDPASSPGTTTWDPSVGLTFMNDLGHYQRVVFCATLRNPTNQTVQVVTVRGNIPPGGVLQVPFFFKSQPPGAYRLRVFVTTSKGVPLSHPISFEFAGSYGAGQAGSA